MADSKTATVEQRLKKFTVASNDIQGIQQHQERLRLLEDLDRRFSSCTNGRGRRRVRLRYLRKKLMWSTVICSTRIVKRTVDIAISATALLLLSPLFLAVAVCIKATDRGPILFWQQRVGKWGTEFPFPKFRSMVTNAEELKKKLLEQNDHSDGSITFKMKRDPRITWIGRIIRKLSIDELPQLMCVLRGQMSLVGPRPPVPMEVEQYTLDDRRRLEATPGLTCIWQVSGRGDIPFDQQVELDVRYIESQSLWVDIKLLLQTVPAVLLGKGAY
jgi:lipopolysaccharide/colanic/teichoic acid biosynthesis glycosyltransferase